MKQQQQQASKPKDEGIAKGMMSLLGFGGAMNKAPKDEDETAEEERKVEALADSEALTQLRAEVDALRAAEAAAKEAAERSQREKDELLFQVRVVLRTVSRRGE